MTLKKKKKASASPKYYDLNQSYDFAVYPKPAITNVQIKTFQHLSKHSYWEYLKGFSHKFALQICSENYLAQEIDFLINVFAENGHSIKRCY